jgi:HemY protein
MIRIVSYLIVIVIGSFLLSWILSSDGLVTIEWLGYHIEISVIFSIFIFLFASFIVAGLLNLVMTIKNLPKNLVNKYHEKKVKEGLVALTQSFEAIASEDLKKAKKLSNIAESSCKDMEGLYPGILLLRYQIAEMEGNKEEIKELLNEMVKYNETKLFSLKNLVQSHINHKNYEEALKLADEAKAIKPNSRWLTESLIEIYKGTNDYESAISVAEKGIKQDLIERAKGNQLLADLYTLSGKKFAAEHQEDNAIKRLKKACDLEPDNIHAKALLDDVIRR